MSLNDVFNVCKMVGIKQIIMHCKIIKILFVLKLLDFVSCTDKHTHNYITLAVLLSSYALLAGVHAHILALKGVGFVVYDVFNVYKMLEVEQFQLKKNKQNIINGIGINTYHKSSKCGNE
eukprot:87506_1